MRYAEYRGKIKSGDVLAWSFRGGWFDSWHSFKINAVRLFQRSEYSHVGIAWVIAGRVFVLESVVPLVRSVPLSGLLPAYVISGRGLGRDQLELALSMVGKAEYSQWEAIKAFFGYNSLENDRIQCAEYVIKVLDLNCQATPSEVVRYMIHHGARLTEVT
jgi:hypothetical protein